MNESQTQVHRLLAVTAATVQTARELCKTLAPSSGDNMFISSYSATGFAPVTHYVSAGLISKQFAGILGNAPATFSAYQSAKASAKLPELVTLAQVEALYATAIIRDDAFGYEQIVLNLLGLKPVAEVK
jgi:hypothetical protein